MQRSHCETAALAALVLALAAVPGMSSSPLSVPVDPPPGASSTGRPGSPSPALQLKGLDGATHSLDQWRGKIILLNFWASWCAPCQAEIPAFVDYQSTYGPRGLQVIGVGVDQERKLLAMQQRLAINYPVLVLDPAASRSTMADWGNPSGVIPYTVVIDRQGRRRHSHLGEWQQGDFVDRVLPLLAE